MNIQSILAVTDLSTDGDRALERAALLAVKHHAFLKIMHVVAGGSPRCTDALERVHHLGKQLAQRFGIAVKTVGHAGNTLESIVEEARYSDLLVLGQGRQRSLAALLCGQLTWQLMRRCSCPVLVTRLEPRKRYDRILVAADLTLESTGLVQLAFAIDDAAEVELFHAVRTSRETKPPGAQASAHPLQAASIASMTHATGRVVSFTDFFDARRNRVMSTLRRSDPVRQAVIQQQYARAGLLVIGNQRGSWLMDFLAGSVAQRILSWSTGDVLVVPHDFQGRARKKHSAAFLPLKRSLP